MDRKVFLFLAVTVVAGAVNVFHGETTGTEKVTGDVTVMFWNLENFFDFVDGGAGESDAEFSSTGPRRWTKKRFYRKCQAVAKTSVSDLLDRCREYWPYALMWKQSRKASILEARKTS